MSNNNPLLDFGGLPRFDQIQPCHVAPAIDRLLADAHAAWQQVIQPGFAPDWVSMAQVLGVATERLSRAWGIVHHLNHVTDTPELRAAHNAALPAVTGFWTSLGSDPRLYTQYRSIDPSTLDRDQARALHNILRDFVLGGADLTGAARDRFTAIALQQAQSSQRFGENVQDATDAFAYFADGQELDGLPDDVKQTARRLAQADGKDGYKLTLQMPCYLPVLQWATDRALRETLYRAYVTRASDQCDAEARPLDNTSLMADLLALRHEQAQLLGYPHFGALSLVTKMAESPGHVLGFLRDLARRATPFARRDVAEMRSFAAEHLGLPTPQAWDWPYIAECLRQARHSLSQQEVRAYFLLPRVLTGMFHLVQNLFDIEIAPATAAVWDPSVQFFQIERRGRLLGQFYLDASARTGKRGGAWMDEVCGRWLRPDIRNTRDTHHTRTLQTPVAYLVCNFADGNDGQPPLLTHDDVTTLFHEFGHGLQHLLTQVDEHEVSGIRGVEWDAVELPSQFLENFCWEWSVLQRLSAHVQTGAPLPRTLFDKMLAAKNFQSGLQTLRQIEWALFDMLLHTQDCPVADVMPLLQKVRDEVAVLQAPAWSRVAHTFSHVFAGGYAAGYYSYLWAEVLSADAYEAFAESADPDGAPCRATGQRFLQAILETGGSRPAMDSFVAFRGRPPTLDAWLRQQGMWQPWDDVPR